MNFFQRLSAAIRMAFMPTKQLTSLIEMWQDNKAIYPETNFQNMVENGWRRNELIFACISKTANTAAQLEIEVRTRRNDTVVPNHPLKALIKNPNPFMSEFDFWASIIIFQKLAGRAYFEKERNNGGQVIRLWPLRPDWMKPIASVTDVISGYEYKPEGVIQPVILPREDVLDIKVFDPLGLYCAWPPVAVAARVGDVDNSVTDYLKLFFEKGGTPPGILKTVQKLRDAQVEDIRRRWRERYGGFESWLEPAVLDSDATYQRIGLTFAEMGFDVLDGRNEARVCMVMDIPPILVGAKVGIDRATYANYSEARRAWWEDSLLPLYVNLSDAIESQLVPDFGTNIHTDWDMSRVPAFTEENNMRWERATTAAKNGLITINEFRHEVGLPDMGDPGNAYLRWSNFVQVPNDLPSDAILDMSSLNTFGETGHSGQQQQQQDQQQQTGDGTTNATNKHKNGGSNGTSSEVDEVRRQLVRDR